MKSQSNQKYFHEFDTSDPIYDGRAAYNFSAGPCVLPKAVLEVAKQEMFDYRGSGQSVMELSHRQDEFRYLALGPRKKLKHS